jgi:DNA-binding FadR family transcriptional regulator
VYCASHNDLLIGTLDGMWDKVDRYRRIGAEARQQPHDLEERRREHQELFAAIVAGDSPGAERVMHDHIRGSLGATATARRTASPAD